MIIGCPSCGTRFNLDPALLGPAGRKVRCASCAHVWLQEPIEEEPPAAEPPVEPIPEDPFPELSSSDRAPAKEFVDADDLGAPTLPASRAPGPPPPPPPAPPPAQPQAPADHEVPDEIAETFATVQAVMADHPPEGSVEAVQQVEEIDDEVVATEAAERVERRRQLGRMLGMLLAFFVVAAALLAGGLVLVRDQLISIMPSTEQLYRAVGMPTKSLKARLEIRNYAAKRVEVQQGTQRVLMIEIEGQVANISEEAVEVPRLRGAIFDKDKRELTSWEFQAQAPLLLSGEQTKFVTRIPDPGAAANDIKLTFVD